MSNSSINPLYYANGVAKFRGLTLPHGFSTMAMGNMASMWATTGEKREINDGPFYQTTGLDGKNRVHIVPSKKSGSIMPWESESDISPIIYLPHADPSSVRGFACDAVFTTDRSLTLSVCPADSFPIIVTNINRGGNAERERDFVALVIAGWRETKRRIVERTITRLLDRIPLIYGVPTKQSQEKFLKSFQVFIGPGVQYCCYRPRFLARVAGAKSDLLSENIKQIVGCGVSPDNIHTATICTCCVKDQNGNYRFFSHQRAKNTGEREGRFLAAVGLGLENPR